MKKSEFKKQEKKERIKDIAYAKGYNDAMRARDKTDNAVREIMKGKNTTAFGELETELSGLSDEKSTKYKNIIVRLKIDYDDQINIIRKEVDDVKKEYQNKIDSLKSIEEKWRAKQQEQLDIANEIIKAYGQISPWIDSVKKVITGHAVNLDRIENVQQIVYDAGKAKNIP